ncbi:hypothetical protein GGS20DRAFT_546253 [Poronia punctata]|nr:hypothetical protein GGS20DRAFT_546253 [Poronia punctata]
MSNSVESLCNIYDFKGIYPEVRVDNNGWSTPKLILRFSSSKSLRASPPAPISVPRDTVEMSVDVTSQIAVGVKARHPTFDLGLGCFGSTQKLVDTCEGEYALLPPADIRLAKDLSDGNMKWGDDEWLDFQFGQKVEDSSDSVMTCGTEATDRDFDSDDHLDELDKLEAARPESEVLLQDCMPGNREGIWDSQVPAGKLVPNPYDSWVEEMADFEEAVSMPEGTRYYKVNGVGA